MKTTPCPNLPRPPDIMRAQCPEANPINYLSDYLWKFNCALNTYFPWMYYDMRYGFCLFPDKTLDCGEMKYDATEFTMNICGTDYTKTWSVPTVYVYHYAANAPYGEKEGLLFDPSTPTWEEAWDDYDNDPLFRGGPGSGSRAIHWGAHDIRENILEVGGQILVLTFDTTSTDPSPVTITLRLDVETIVEDLGTPTVKLYKLTDTFDPETHWDYTDSHIADQEISATGNYDIEITESDINIGGTTQILVRLASTDVSQPIPPTPEDTEYNAILFEGSFEDNIWLKFTY